MKKSILEYESEFGDVVGEIKELFKEKNSKYNASYFNHDEWFYDILRKYDRLRNIKETNSFEIKDFEEQLKDLSIYCIMAIMKARNKDGRKV